MKKRELFSSRQSRRKSTRIKTGIFSEEKLNGISLSF